MCRAYKQHVKRDFETVNGDVNYLVPTSPVFGNAFTEQKLLVVEGLEASRRWRASLKAPRARK